MTDQAFLSIVVVGRNDNYGGDFTQRFQNCIDWNTQWLEKHGIDTELVFVNWNPLADEPSIREQIRWPQNRKHVRYRIITVPEEVHRLFIDPAERDTVPLFEFIAKNVGIRRTQGEHVLCINADILIHPRIIRYLAERSLDRGTYYRADRWDYQQASELSVPALYKAGIMVFKKGWAYPLGQVRSKQLHYLGLNLFNPIRLKWNLWKEQHVEISNKYGFNVVYHNGGYLAHCHASGDFMLMHRTNWMQLKGYPEYTSISTHTDSLFTILAFAKLKEKVFPVPVFHQAHPRRYGWDEIQKDEKFKKAYDFFEAVASSVKKKEPVDGHLNPDNWGMPDLQLVEERF